MALKGTSLRSKGE
jgi:predicted Zn-dependent peptidase